MIKKNKNKDKRKLSFFEKLKLSLKGLGESFSKEVKKEKIQRDTVFIALAFGDSIGLLFQRTYFSLILLPYVFRELEWWKKRTLKEKDITDKLSK